MAKVYGVNTGGNLQGQPFQSVPSDLAYGTDEVINRDYAALTTSNDIGDTIVLCSVPSNSFLSPGATVYYDALGTGVELEIGDATYPAGLSAAFSVASAGSAALHQKFTAGQIAYPLWKKLGYSSDPGGNITLLATIQNANVGSGGNVGWNITGKHH